MSFSFNFAGDDIDDTDNAENGSDRPAHAAEHGRENQQQPEAPVMDHSLSDLLSTLPGNISYTTTHLTSPHASHQALIPRRALFDVRMQLMAEDEPSGGPAKRSAVQDMLDGASDITRNVYEGGFKSWEGALDLALLLLDRAPRTHADDLAGLAAVIELGCGTALPALVLFQHALHTPSRIRFMLADYNADVLRLLTLPNLLLTWAMHAAPGSLRPAPPSLDELGRLRDGAGDLDVTPALLAAFEQDLARRGIAVHLLSGAWSPQLTTNLTAPLTRDDAVLVLGAETIYSPASLDAFCDTLRDVLGHVRTGRAYVAAKRVYFGVGGGVDAFKAAMARRCGTVRELTDTGIEACERGGSGVGRCLLEAAQAA